MERLQLKAQSRREIGKGAARRIRQQGLIPGIVYGVGQEPVAVAVNGRELDRALLGASSLNALFDLDIDGKGTLPVMLRDYQVDNVDRKFLHVDFQKIDLTRKIKVEVPVRLVGKAIGVKEGGILEHLRRELEVICLPTAIPGSLEVDVSNLDIGDTVHIHDLKLPEGVELSTISDVAIAAVVQPVEEKIEVPVEGEAATEPEVIGEKKAVEGEAPASEEKKGK